MLDYNSPQKDNSAGSANLYVDDNMIFCPYKLDPIWALDIQEIISNFLRNSVRNENSLMKRCMNKMEESEKELIRALI
jgi:hypothetical protein